MPENKDYSVTIVEHITETREIKIKASSHKEAAKAAYDLWIVHGEDEGHTVEVVERDYEVLGKGLTECFSASDIELDFEELERVQ